MRSFRSVLLLVCVSCILASCVSTGAAEPGGRWSVERAQAWDAQQPWLCGFNYVPRNAISYTEMFMPYCFDAELIDEEMALAQKTGFNCVRVVLPFVVWEHDPEEFKKTLDTFLGVCYRHGLRVMPALFDDCVFGEITNPWYGKQPEVIEGWYANGWTPSPGHDMVRDPETYPRLKKYVQDVIGTFSRDKRVFVWDLYNEPTNGGLGHVSLGLVQNVFDWARQINPDQPLTIAIWNGDKALNEILFARSDIITFHHYRSALHLAGRIRDFKKHDRPVICTEWLNRKPDLQSYVETNLGIFLLEDVGAMHWGLVAGKTQTPLGWGHRPGDPPPERWQHDLYHGDLTEYDPHEMELFRRAIHLANGK